MPSNKVASTYNGGVITVTKEDGKCFIQVSGAASPRLKKAIQSMQGSDMDAAWVLRQLLKEV